MILSGLNHEERMMPMNITPGSKVSIKVTRPVNCEAAAKTLSRLFAKDPRNKGARRHRKKLLASAFRTERRGGRPWEIRPRAPRLFQPVKGDTCSVFATCDVIADLGSVARFIEIKPAK